MKQHTGHTSDGVERRARAFVKKRLAAAGMIGALALVAPAVAWPSQATAGSPSVVSISVKKERKSATYVVSTTGRIHVQSFFMSKPPQLVVDISGARHRLGTRRMKGDGRFVKRVRSSQYKLKPDFVTRLVFDMKKDVPYEVKTSKHKITVRFFREGDKKIASKVSKKSKPAAGTPSSGRSGARTVAKRRAGAVSTTGTRVSEPARVTYISIEAVYINAGRKAGVTVGDTLRAMRIGKSVGRLVVTSVASRSAACKPLSSSGEIKAGDALVFDTTRRIVKGRPGPSSPRDTRVAAAPAMRRSTRLTARDNVVSGYAAFQNHWQQDLGDAKTTWLQPSVVGRLTVRKIAGKDLTFRLRHRSLYTKRTRALDSAVSEDGWTHQLSELMLVYGREDSPIEMGLGRVLSPYIRGIGYIDGGYIAFRVSPRYRVGVAVGTEPDEETSRRLADHKKFGGFVTYETEMDKDRHLASTLAISTSYVSGAVSREFFYVQNVYTHRRRLSVYQSVEIDVNRQWRRSMAGGPVTFSNFYLTSNVFVTDVAILDFSFDARRNVRDFNTLEIPDSLFDSRLRKGLDGGVSLRLPHGISLRSNAGIRYGNDGEQNIRFATGFMNVRNIYRRGHNLTLRLSWSSNAFARSYRPVASYQMPIQRRMRGTMSVGGNLLRSGSVASDSYYFELGANRAVGRRYYLSGSWRQYVAGPLKSLQVITEAGINF